MTAENAFFCEACGAEVKPGAGSCPACGSRFTATRCPRCGREGRAREFTRGCPGCGYLGVATEQNFDVEEGYAAETPPKRPGRPVLDWPARRFWILTGLLVVILGALVFLYLR